MGTKHLQTQPKPFFNWKKAKCFIEIAIEHYAGAPAWFTNWLDDLYIRLNEDWLKITMDEIISCMKLFRDGTWMPEPLAVNHIYKLFDY